MVKRTIIVFLAMLTLISLSACNEEVTREEQIKETSSNNEVEKNVSQICGIVKSVDEDNINVQICGNVFEGVDGYCYIDIANEYDSIEVNDSVIIYYSGKIKFTGYEDSLIKAENIEINSVEKYDSDFTFEAKVYITGNLVDENMEEYPPNDPRSGCEYFFESLDDEPEWNFGVIYTGDDVLKVHLQRNVTVKYNPDTMEVVSVIQ